MTMSRRDVLKLGAASALLAGVRIAEAKPTGKKIPIGLQLYSVREACAKDLPGVLEAVGKMGYKGVEFAGYHGRSAKELRKMMDDNGLVCCGTHTGWDTLQGDNFKKTIAFNKTLGNKYLVVPGLPHKQVESAEAIVRTAKIFTELAAKAKPLGMHVGYHAHGGDFKKFDGQTEWDLLFSNSSPDVIMQMDLGNCIGGGGDPYAILKKYPKRSLTIHLKEHGGKPGAVIGEGEIKWKEIFEICETIGGTQWYIVEQESYNVPPLEAARLCLNSLKKMGK